MKKVNVIYPELTDEQEEVDSFAQAMRDLATITGFQLTVLDPGVDGAGAEFAVPTAQASAFCDFINSATVYEALKTGLKPA